MQPAHVSLWLRPETDMKDEEAQPRWASYSFNRTRRLASTLARVPAYQATQRLDSSRIHPRRLGCTQGGARRGSPLFSSSLSPEPRPYGSRLVYRVPFSVTFGLGAGFIADSSLVGFFEVGS